MRDHAGGFPSRRTRRSSRPRCGPGRTRLVSFRSMAGQRRIAGACLLGLLLCLAWVPSASAMSRKTATKIALRVLQPQKADATNGVVVLGLARPLGPKDFVTDAKAGTYKV